MKTVSIKTILILSFQLFIIIILVGVGTAYVKKLASRSENIVKDNLRSVQYCSVMQKDLYQLHTLNNPDTLNYRREFETNLDNEKKNITEPGEKELADQIETGYFLWLRIPADSTYNRLLENINSVSELNITGIEKRNDSAQSVARNANTSMLLVGFFGALAAFIFTFSFIGQLFSAKGRS